MIKAKNKRVPTLIAVAACLSVWGCGKSKQETLTNESKQISSWIASAELVAQAWSQGKVPSAYAHRSLETFAKELRQHAENLQSISDNRSPQFIATVEQLEHGVAELDAAVKQNNKEAISRLLPQLSDRLQALSSVLNAPNQTQ
jgi:hypothetical protein